MEDKYMTLYAQQLANYSIEQLLFMRRKEHRDDIYRSCIKLLERISVPFENKSFIQAIYISGLVSTEALKVFYMRKTLLSVTYG